MDVSDSRIAPALDALLRNDADDLRALVDADGEIVSVRWNGNTLLEWCTQPPHGIAPPVISVLISAGAELDRALNLAGCWSLAGMRSQLLAAGADPAARADADITPLESAAMHGSVEAADVLVASGLHRPGLWLAAATGQVDELRSWIHTDGDLARPAGEYRPNLADVGRPAGGPSTDHPSVILGEALVFAAANDRAEAVDLLLDVGVDIDARPYRNTTGLHLAVQFHKPAMVEHLLDRGANPMVTDDNHGGTAHGWAVACDDGTPAASRIRELLGAT
ncbi:ankyrin repeat domain-containing protein [Iamia majanohamensis]|uniref:Ankyrin repeat domain-containing protein n=1 Tax=Iamia majanohamensis TaxID=467976 RepID=A0AAF0BSB7_9ACTN|nr:ankyrin repeat domain-containing protein [Iamia majanohamensis]WCO68046.1 ankyrin repeat domain-containing protein [Iamia majanohamensis]